MRTVHFITNYGWCLKDNVELTTSLYILNTDPWVLIPLVMGTERVDQQFRLS